MNLIALKSPKDLKLDGIAVDCEFHDGSLASCTLTDSKGQIVKFALDSYCLRAYVPAPPKKKTVHVVSGTVRVAGTPIREEFEEPYQATMRRSELEQADVCDSVAVAVEEVEIPF